MGVYTTRPRPVEARRFGADNFEDLYAWGGPRRPITLAGWGDDPGRLAVHTPAGTAYARVGDWIVRATDGTYTVCADADFAADYTEVAAVGQAFWHRGGSLDGPDGRPIPWPFGAREVSPSGVYVDIGGAKHSFCGDLEWTSIVAYCLRSELDPPTWEDAR